RGDHPHHLPPLLHLLSEGEAELRLPLGRTVHPRCRFLHLPKKTVRVITPLRSVECRLPTSLRPHFRESEMSTRRSVRVVSYSSETDRGCKNCNRLLKTPGDLHWAAR